MNNFKIKPFSAKLKQIILALSTIATANAVTAGTMGDVTAMDNWTGPYVGGSFGYGWTSGEYSWDNFGFAWVDQQVIRNAGQVNYNDSWGSLGAVLGYDYQFGSVVAGAFGSIDSETGSIRRSTDVVPSGLQPAGHLEQETKGQWVGTIGGRVGFVAAPQVLVYGTGGFAAGQIRYSSELCFPADGHCNTVNNNKTDTGWTAGAGAEYKFNTTGWSARGEVSYYDFGKKYFTTQGIRGSDGFVFPGREITNNFATNFTSAKIIVTKSW